jgi:hypothetical protein
VTGFTHSVGVSFSPPGSDVERSDLISPRVSPLEWTRRRRTDRENKRLATARDKTMTRLGRLGAGWHLIDALTLGLKAPDSFVAIGPGGVFAVTVRSQGRSRVLISGDTVQIKGLRPTYVAQARALANSLSGAFTRMAGTKVPVTPILAFSGSGLLSLYGLPKDCVVMPHRELDHLLNAYGHRIANRTVDKLASIARHPATVVDLRSEQLAAAYSWQASDLPADKLGGRR